MPALIARACVRCGKSFGAKTSRASYCTDVCRALASKERRSGSNVVKLPGSVEPRGPLEVQVAAELAGQAETSVGRQALLMARRLDAGVSDSALRSVSIRLDELLAEASRRAAVQSAAADVEANPIAFLIDRAERRRGVG